MAYGSYPTEAPPDVSEEHEAALDKIKGYNRTRREHGLPLLDVNGNEVHKALKVPGRPGERPATQWTAIGGLVI